MKKTMMIFILLVMFVAILLFVGDTEISFSPFRITINKLYFMVGVLFMTLSVLCFLEQGKRDGFKEVQEMIKEVKSEMENE